jgi:hypothetical protein
MHRCLWRRSIAISIAPAAPGPGRDRSVVSCMHMHHVTQSSSATHTCAAGHAALHTCARLHDHIDRPPSQLILHAVRVHTYDIASVALQRKGSWPTWPWLCACGCWNSWKLASRRAHADSHPIAIGNGLARPRQIDARAVHFQRAPAEVGIYGAQLLRMRSIRISPRPCAQSRFRWFRSR